MDEMAQVRSSKEYTADRCDTEIFNMISEFIAGHNSDELGLCLSAGENRIHLSQRMKGRSFNE